MTQKRREQLVRAVGELDPSFPHDLEPIEALEPTAEELGVLAAGMQAAMHKVWVLAMRRTPEEDR